LRGPTSEGRGRRKGEGWDGRGEEGKGGKGKGGEGRGKERAMSPPVFGGSLRLWRLYDERKLAQRFTHFLNLIKLVLITKRSHKPSPVLMANIGHNKRYKTML